MSAQSGSMSPAWAVRPATAADLPELAALRGLRSAPTLPTTEHELLLVAADPGTARLLASVRLRPAIGLTLPRCWYHVGCTVHAAAELQLFHRQRTLLLGNDHTGASELADLAWAEHGLPLAEQAAALRGVVQTVLLAMARSRTRYAPQLIAELPGLRDGAGQSPFWAGLGRHFYTGDPQDAEARHGAAWRSHVAALLPRHPVMASFLPAAAQAAIAQVAPEARLLRELLEETGLRYGHHVTVDDGGPVLEADLDALPAVTRSRVWATALGDGSGSPHLVMGHDLRALRAPATAGGARLLLGAATLAALDLAEGDAVWALPL
jgi:arginine N-succinyltransferase